MPEIRYHKSPPRLKLIRKEEVRVGKHFIERWYYEDDKGKEHVKTVNRSKFF